MCRALSMKNLLQRNLKISGDNEKILFQKRRNTMLENDYPRNSAKRVYF